MNQDWTPKERYLRALHGEEVDRIPVPAFCTHPLVGLMDAAGVTAPDIHYRLDDMVRFAVAAYEILGFEGVRLPTDSVVEAEAMGCPIARGGREMNPSVISHPFSLDGPGIRGDLLQEGRIPLILKAVTAVKKRVGENIPVTSHFMGPMSIAGHLVGAEPLMLGLVEQPEKVKNLFASITEYCIQMGNALTLAGADALQMPDPMASADLISPKMYGEFVLPCHKRIFGEVHCPVVLHICGNSGPMLPHILESGVSGFSFDSKVSVAQAKRVVGDNISLVGNISTTETLLSGTSEDVVRETQQAIRDGINVVAPSCGFAPRTPLENVRAMVQAAKGKARFG